MSFSNPPVHGLLWVVGVGQAEGVFDYATPEVPLSLFGLGHDWACTFRGAPLPDCGQA
jgi:hypothetical protein